MVVFDREAEFSTMDAKNHNRNKDPAGIFQEQTLPSDTRLAGVAAGVSAYRLGFSEGARRIRLLTSEQTDVLDRRDSYRRQFERTPLVGAFNTSRNFERLY